MNFQPLIFQRLFACARQYLFNTSRNALIIILASYSADSHSNTNQYESLTKITNHVKNELLTLYATNASYSEIKIRVNDLDNRLRLLQCNDPWNVKIPSNLSAGRISVSVECSTNQSWQVFVTAEVKLMVEAVVANHSLRRGEILMENDVKKSLIDLSNLRQGYLTNLENAVGYELKRNIALGEPLRHQQLAMPMVISRGEIVSIYAISTAISVEASGTALGNGRIGELIRVKNNRSGRIVQAKVTAAGKVEITL
jgi:flagella basal body P-ring formation protein FlgA